MTEEQQGRHAALVDEPSGPTLLRYPQIGDIEVFDPPPDRRRFSPQDFLRLAIGVVLIVVGTLVARAAQETVAGLEEDLLRAFARLPDTIESLILSVAQFATSLVPTVAIVVLLFLRRWRVALLLLATSLLANLAMAGASVLAVDRGLDEVLETLGSNDVVGDPGWPNSYVLAMTAAQVTVAAAFMSRRWKRVLWWGVGILVLLRLTVPGYPAFDIVLAIGTGLAVGSLVLLLYGSPNNEPTAEELVDTLRGVGIDPRRIVRPRQTRSGARYHVTDVDGAQHDLLVRTSDDRDSDLLVRAYRSVRFQASEVSERYASIEHQVEHEALVLTLAERAGVRAPTLEQLGTTAGGAAFLLSRDPPSRAVGPEDLGSSDLLRAIWTELDALHRAGIAHRRLGLESIRIDHEGRPWMRGFDEADIDPTDQECSRDVAVLLTETALVTGAVDAVDAAVDVLGDDQVASALRMLQPLALPPATRRRAKDADGILDDLQNAIRDRTGVEDVALEELERIKPRTILIIGASTLAFYSLLPQLANLSDTIDAFGSAEPLWIIATLIASAGTYFFAAICFSGAVSESIPFAPNLRAQIAASFTGLVGPAGAGGFALTGRFLQRMGVGGPEAAASVAVNAIAGFAVHLALLGGFIFWSRDSDLGGFSLPDSTTVLLVLAGLLALLGIMSAIGPVRTRVLRPAWTNVRVGLSQIASVFRRPMRVAALFGGSAGLSLTYVVAMACAIEAFGGGIGFVEIGAGYLAAVAIATLAPTPGGLGAIESALIAAFTGFGLGSGEAVSAVLTFRLATFWFPILPGWVSLNWMQRNDEV